MTLDAFQLACLPVLLFAYALRVRGGPWAERLAELGALVVGGYAAEQTCISAYGFYAYAPGWALRVGDVPLLVPLIWPMVILSARELVGRLAPRMGVGRTALWVGLFVTFDASLMEVVAVAGGYWRWSEPGYLGIPLIGILGWGYFAAAASLWLDSGNKSRFVLLPVVAALGTHALLLGTWWGLWRWVLRGELPLASLGVVAAWALALALWVWRAPGVAAASTLAARVPAALLFVGLLALCADDGAGAWRWAHVGLVALPYLVLTARWSAAWRAGRVRTAGVRA